jgi:hypothetical protein
MYKVLINPIIQSRTPSIVTNTRDNIIGRRFVCFLYPLTRFIASYYMSASITKERNFNVYHMMGSDLMGLFILNLFTLDGA